MDETLSTTLVFEGACSVEPGMQCPEAAAICIAIGTTLREHAVPVDYGLRPEQPAFHPSQPYPARPGDTPCSPLVLSSTGCNANLSGRPAAVFIGNLCRRCHSSLRDRGLPHICNEYTLSEINTELHSVTRRHGDWSKNSDAVQVLSYLSTTCHVVCPSG